MLRWIVLASATFGCLTHFFARYASHFAFIFLYLVVVLALLAWHLPRARTWFVNLACACLTLCLFESYLAFKPAQAPALWEGSYSSGAYFAADALRGYAAAPRAAEYTSRRRTAAGDVIYDVTYRMDRHGLRVTPHIVAPPPGAAWFFGCSFTIGEGVNNERTLPWQYALLTQRRTLNFGFHGYGPHQMLRMLETGYVSGIDPQPPRIVFYNAVSVHIDRAAGLAPWDKNGPRYVLDGAGIRHDGTFRDGRRIASLADALLHKSLIYARLIRPHLFQRADGDRERFVRIVAQAHEWLAKKHGSRLTVVLWDHFRDRDAQSDSDSDFIDQALTGRGVLVLRVSRMLDGRNDARYFIPGDGHPSAAAFARVAEHLARLER